MPVWFWITLWSVLVLLTLLGGLLLGRWLWRTFTALTAELERAEELTRPGLTRLEEALGSTPGTTPDDAGDTHRASMFSDDLTTHHARVAALREAGRDRKAARRERHRVTWESWRRFNDPPRTDPVRHDPV